MSEYDCEYCNREFESKKAVDSHIGQVHPEQFPWNDKDFIYEEYIVKQRTRGDIADELGCSRATITNACKRFGFEINREERQSTHAELTDEKWLREKYEQSGAPTIAESIGCSAHAVYCALARHGIKTDDRHLDLPSGREHPKWKGGHEYNRGHTWAEQRKKALNRDRWRCQSCGMSNGEHKVRFAQQIHVHHITRFGDFESHKQANQLDNLITLCRPCHDKLEGKSAKEIKSKLGEQPPTAEDILEWESEPYRNWGNPDKVTL